MRNSATVHESGFSHTILSAGFQDGMEDCPRTPAPSPKFFATTVTTHLLSASSDSLQTKKQRMPDRSIAGRQAKDSITFSGFLDRRPINTSPTL